MEALADSIGRRLVFFAAGASQPETPPSPVEAPEGPVPPPRKPSGLTAVAFLLIGLAAGYVAYQQTTAPRIEDVQQSTAIQKARFGTRTAAAVRGDLQTSLRLSGTIVAQQFAAIRTPRQRLGRRFAGGGGGGGGDRGGGALTLVSMAEPGSHVEAGQVVAEFDHQSQQQMIDDQKAQVIQAKAVVEMQRATLMMQLEATRQDMRTAKAEYEKAVLDVKTAEVKSEIEAEILKNTRDQNLATYKQLEEEVKLLETANNAQLRAAEIDAQQEEIDLKRAEMNAATTTLKTPIAGTVVMQTVFRNGTFSQVANGDEVYPGAYFMQVVDPKSMVLEASVNQADSNRVRVGQEATVHLDAYPGKSWKGRVSSVAAMTESSGGGGGRRFGRGGSSSYVRNVTVLVEILERDPVIIPDLSASADVVLDTRKDVLLAPREAVRHDDQGWFVQLKKSGAPGFVRTAVEPAAKNDTQVAVAAGLDEGDEIALSQVRTQ